MKLHVDKLNISVPIEKVVGHYTVRIADFDGDRFDRTWVDLSAPHVRTAPDPEVILAPTAPTLLEPDHAAPATSWLAASTCPTWRCVCSRACP